MTNLKLKHDIRVYLIIVCILIVGAVVRFVYLNGDAPVADISRSGVFYVDEGTYAHNVVNKILFGEWFLENDYNACANVPVFSVCQYVVLKTFGVNLKSLRTGGIIYSMIFLLFLWLLIKQYNLHVAMVAVIFGSFNYFFMIYNRLALLENLLVLFLIIITTMLFFYHRKQTIGWLIAAILFFWIGYFVKATILFFLPLIIITIVVTTTNSNQKLKHLWTYFTISSVILLTMYFVWIKPHIFDWSYFQAKNIHRMISGSYLHIFQNYARYLFNLKLFQFMPVTYTIYLFYLGYLMYEIFAKKKLHFFEWFFLGWSICGFLFLGFFKYSPPRFSLILIPAIIILTAHFIMKLYRNELDFSSKKKIVLLLPVIMLSLCQISFGFYRIVAYHQHYLSCYLSLVSIPVIIILYLLMSNKLRRQWVAIALFSSIILINMIQIVRYYSGIQFSYYNAIQDMKKVVQTQNSADNILLGDIATLVSVELKVKAVNINFRSETECNRIMQNEPNLLVLQENDELQRLANKLPYYLHDVDLIKTYTIFKNYINNEDTHFYRINPAYRKNGILAQK